MAAAVSAPGRLVMDITVLAKVVSDRLTVGPEGPSGLTRREAGSSFLNPFDQRALRAAVDLRRPGERLTVVSMGPSHAEAVLAPYLTAGVDRVLLLSDPGLRGADIVATARALGSLLKPLGRQIVLAGERATDSDVGVLAAALSPHLWFPAVAGVRKIEREDPGSELVVTAETEDGWARYAVRPPCILSVGEKIAKPLKPPASGAAPAGRVETLTLADLSSDGSVIAPLLEPRTRIVRWTPIEETRAARVADAAHIDQGLDLLRARKAALSPRPPLPRLASQPSVAAEGPFDRELLVLASDAQGLLEPRAPAVISALSRDLPGFWVSAVWAGPHPPHDVTEALQRAGARRAYGLHGPTAEVLPVVATLALERALDRRPATAAVALPDTTFGRQVAGRLASRIDRGVVTEVERVSYDADTSVLRWTKPSFAHRAWVTVETAAPPAIALLRTYGASAEASPPGVSLDWVDIPFEVPSVAIEPIDRGTELLREFGELENAEMVVCVGMGVGGPDGLRALLPMLGTAGAALAATRRVVDAGWLPGQLQIGLTGRSVHPRLGVLVGVSGSPNQMVGWRRSGTLVAINSDPAAPVFSQVDVGFVGRWEELLPRVLAAWSSPT